MKDPTPEPGNVQLISTLAIAGLLSGLIIVLVFQWARPIIDANNARFLREAVLRVVPGATSMRKLVPHMKTLTFAKKGDKSPGVYAAYNAKSVLLGYAIPAKGKGFQDDISLIFGFAHQRKQVIGMEVLESRETPGLGDKIYKDKDWLRNNFRTLSIIPHIVLYKKKPGKSKANNEVDAITGATISSKAVIKTINQANKKWVSRIQQYNSSAIKHPTTKRAP